MSVKVYNRFNFHRHTFCVFQEVEQTAIAHLKSGYKSKSGSIYYFTNEGVYRQSNHWGRAANCKWRLESENKNPTGRNRIGFALWNHFHNDNDFEKLYFITADFATKSAGYFHKDQGSMTGKPQLRTAAETTKRLKQIRNLFENDDWLRHFDIVDNNAFRNEIILKLIETDLPLQQIKRDVFNAL